MSGRSEIFRSQTSSLGDSGQHLRADFLIVVERKDEVSPGRAAKRSVRTGLPFQLPTDLQQSGQRAPPSSMASCSSGLKRDVQEFGRGFAMFEAFGNHAERQRLHA